MFKMDENAARFGVTAVENRFILDYLPAAKGDYIKVYLWGLMRSMWPEQDDSLDRMAEELFLSPAEIEAALRYWERRALVFRTDENPPRYAFFLPSQRQDAAGAPLQAENEYVAFAESVYAAFGDRRKVTPSEIALAWEWVQDVGLKAEVVLMLLHHCIASRGVQFSFKKAEPLAVRMKEENVTTCEDADAFFRHAQAVQDGARSVLSRMGKRRAASEDEIALYEKWLKEWGFAPEAILDACVEMTKGDPSFKYLDGILDGLRSRSDARTGKAVQRQLQREQQTADSAKEVFSLLGRFSAPVAARLYSQYAAVYPHAVLLLAAEECHRKGGRIEDWQALLDAWQQKGLKTENDVRDYLARFREANTTLRAVFEACGHAGRPTAADRALYEKWKGYGMEPSLFLYAAEQARAAEGNKIAYLDKVLEAWREAGVTKLEQARAQRRTERGQREKTVGAQQYAQRVYTEEELSAVSTDLIEEARKQRG